MGKKHLEKLYNLEKRANKNLFVTGLLTFLFSPLGYLYTNRYWGAAITFFFFFAMVEEADFEEVWGVIAVGSTIENIISVRSARDKWAIAQNGQANIPFPFQSTTTPLQNQQQKFPPRVSQPQNLEVQILKAIKEQGEMTISDIVIATELSPATVRETLLKLETEQLICGYNRHSDGAVVYKNI